MVKRIDSDALGVLNKSLGLTGAGSPTTELTDGVVDQFLQVNEIARRGRTLAGSAGVYNAMLQNVNTDAETILSTVDVYNVPAGATSIWPTPIPAQFDVWLLAAAARRQSGTGTITAMFSIQLPASTRAFGIDDSGVAVAQTDPVGLVAFTGLISTSTIDLNQPGSFGPYKRFAIRIPRGSGASTGVLRWSTVSSATSTWNLNMILGLFPVALGQDGIV